MREEHPPNVIQGPWGRETEPSRLLDRLDIPLHQPIELAVWAKKPRGLRCRLLPGQEPITFKKVRREVEGEILTVAASKVWQHRNTVYMSGDIIDCRLDVGALGLQPLGLTEMGEWLPESELELEDTNGPFGSYLKPILARGPCREFQMEQAIPGFDPDACDDDPIVRASEARHFGDWDTAYRIMAELLSDDLRCLDAHAHLGNWSFNASDEPHPIYESEARRHYEAGVRIGELSLGDNFDHVLPWALINNRPFLRCLHGYGLCLWRAGEVDAARSVFERMLRLNPSDDQAVCPLLADIDSGRSWYHAWGEQ
ncbi:MAG: hypothetical protein GF331_01405 [Chitinivibrionales bacterium]|nr:hypothetical protein [Chitinivibrionales bacterium]